MIAVWSTGIVEIPDAANPGFADVEAMPHRTCPPKGCPSIYVNRNGAFPMPVPGDIFGGIEYFDLMLPATDRNVKEFLATIADWSDFPTWVAHRDTPQTRWLRRLKEITGHLGNAILKLMEKDSIVIKIV